MATDDLNTDFFIIKNSGVVTPEFYLKVCQGARSGCLISAIVAAVVQLDLSSLSRADHGVLYCAMVQVNT